jgi:Spy/CpxP family protein refolding chaperone
MKKSIVISLFVTFFICNIMFAQPEPGKGGMPMGKRPGIAKLNLTPEQEKQFSDINFDHQKKMLELKGQIEKNQLELKKMVVDGKIDEKKLIDITEANSKLQNEIKSSGIKRWIAVNKILNDEQKQIWAKQLGMFGKMKELAKGAVRERMKERLLERKPMMRRR